MFEKGDSLKFYDPKYDKWYKGIISDSNSNYIALKPNASFGEQNWAIFQRLRALGYDDKGNMISFGSLTLEHAMCQKIRSKIVLLEKACLV